MAMFGRKEAEMARKKKNKPSPCNRSQRDYAGPVIFAPLHFIERPRMEAIFVGI